MKRKAAVPNPAAPGNQDARAAVATPDGKPSLSTASRSPARHKDNPATDLRSVSRMVVDAVQGVTGIVEDMHRNIAGVSPIVGRAPTGKARGIAGFAYRSVRGVTRAVGSGIDAVLSQVAPLVAGAGSVPQRAALQAVLNGVLGDYLHASGNPLAIPMQFRRGGVPLALDRAALAADPACAGSRLLILAHGLCMNDLQWLRDGHDHGAALAADLGYTPLYLYYNSGRHVGANGREFADLLERLVAAWPVKIDELVILGHSMGGLLARSACHHAAAAKHAWPRRLTRIIFLGTPHEGAPLERAGSIVDRVLGISPYTAPFAKLGKVRSTGVQDLRLGHILDEGDRRAGGSHASVVEAMVPLPPRVRCYAIAGTSQARAGKPGARLPGDGLVPVRSALGEHDDPARALDIPAARRRIVYGTNHFDLLASRAVYAQLRRWLARPRRGVAAATRAAVD